MKDTEAAVLSLIEAVGRQEVKALVVLANAAGYKYVVEGASVRILGVLGGHDQASWNPASDDGDALRLAVFTGNTDLSMLAGELVLAEQTNGFTGIALIRRAILWAVLIRHLAKRAA